MEHFDDVDVQGRDLIMEYGAGLGSVSDLAWDAQGCLHFKIHGNERFIEIESLKVP